MIHLFDTFQNNIPDDDMVRTKCGKLVKIDDMARLAYHEDATCEECKKIWREDSTQFLFREKQVTR